MKKIVFVLFLFISVIRGVSASTCSAEQKAELIQKVSMLNINYEEFLVEYIEENPEPPFVEPLDLSYYIFKINILNMTNDFKILVKNDVNSDIIEVSYSDTNTGKFEIDQFDQSEVVNYTFEIYGSDSGDCSDEIIAVRYLVIPKYNPFYLYNDCSIYPDLEVCQVYTTIPNISQEDFSSAISKYKIDLLEQEDEENNVFSFMSNNYVRVILFIVCTCGLIFICLLLFKKMKGFNYEKK